MATPQVNSITLEPMDLHDAVQLSELQRQRVICGWDKDASVIEGWRTANSERKQALFWVIPTSLSHLPPSQRYAGHIAMYKSTYDNENGADDVLPDLTVMNVTTLFILPEHRGAGLARAAVKALEGMAKTEPYGWPECKAMTLNTLARRYVEDDEWRKIAAAPHKSLGIPLPAKGMSNEDWYARMGYVKWKEMPLYSARSEDGSEFKFIASFMWKSLE